MLLANNDDNDYDDDDNNNNNDDDDNNNNNNNNNKNNSTKTLYSNMLAFSSPKPLVSLSLIQFPLSALRNQVTICEDFIPYVCSCIWITATPAGRVFVIFPIHCKATVFDWLQQTTNVTLHEILRTFTAYENGCLL